MSYFPNWKISGAKGPYRVAPNLMVVVPTQNEVRLNYGYTKFELFAYLLTAAGIAIVIMRWRRKTNLGAETIEASIN
jgi:hypothetical protein